MNYPRRAPSSPRSPKPGACLLLAEPTGHVNAAEFEDELQATAQVGFQLADRPAIRRSRTALLKKV